MAEVDYNIIANNIKEAFQDSLLTALNSRGTAPIASGKLLNEVKCVYDNGVFIITMLDYWKEIEFGRKPSKRTSKAPRSVGKPLAPPYQPILQWVQQKRIGGANDRATAYAIQNSLRYKTIAPRPFVERAEMEANRIVENEINIVIEDKLNQVFK